MVSRYVEPGIYTQMEIANGYKCPESEKDYNGFKQYVEDALPTETPVMFRLHPNAEITYVKPSYYTLYTPFIHLYYHIYTYVHPLYMYIHVYTPYIHHIYT